MKKEVANQINSKEFIIVFNGDARITVRNKNGWTVDRNDFNSEISEKCLEVKDKSFQSFCEKLQLTAKRKIVNLF
jgi:hypothetical protein